MIATASSQPMMRGSAYKGVNLEQSCLKLIWVTYCPGVGGRSLLHAHHNPPAKFVHHGKLQHKRVDVFKMIDGKEPA